MASLAETIMERARARAATREHAPVVAPCAPQLAQSLAIREVLSLRADWLVGLPLPPVLVLEAAGVGLRVDTRPRPSRGAFSAAEWLCLVAAAESGRAGSCELVEWANRKRAHASWTLDIRTALGGAINFESPRWSVGRVLETLGAELRAVLIDGGEP